MGSGSARQVAAEVFFLLLTLVAVEHRRRRDVVLREDLQSLGDCGVRVQHNRADALSLLKIGFERPLFQQRADWLQVLGDDSLPDEAEKEGAKRIAAV